MNQSIACMLLGAIDGALVSTIIVIYFATTRRLRNSKNRDSKTYIAILAGYIVIFLSLFIAFKIAILGGDYFGLVSKQTDNFPFLVLPFIVFLLMGIFIVAKKESAWRKENSTRL